MSTIEELARERKSEPPSCCGTTQTPVTTESTDSVQADKVRALADRLAQGDEPGFGMTVLDFPRGQVTLYWHGDLPRGVRDVTENPGKGLTVKVVPTKFSKGQLAAAARRVLKNPAEIGADVVEVKNNRDMSGVVVSVTHKTYTPDLARVIEIVAQVPVRVEIK